MSPEYLASILAQLPEDERAEAACRIAAAKADGVEHIGLWHGLGDDGRWMPGDLSDLFGNCPRRREELRAKGDTWSSGLVSLSRYATAETGPDRRAG